jgi:MYXO-CTERM domain-containing protein
VTDTWVSYDNASGLIASTMTWSSMTPNNNNSYMQGALALATLDPNQGLINPKFVELPELQGDRPHMRPIVGIGKNFIVDIFASEDNGENNNPQAVAWVFDRTGTMLNISNTTRGKAGKPTNLITLSGQNDNQQYGPHSICPLPPEADGSESFIVGVQRNNQQAKVMKVTVNVDASGAATVTVPYLKTIIQNAQHNRVSLACPTDGVAHNDQIVATAVEANTQPANVGVRAVLVNTKTGAKIASTLIAKSQPDQRLYAVQPTAQYLDDTHVAIAYQMATNQGNNNNQNGHDRNKSENLSHLALLEVASTGFTVRDDINRVAPYQRHSEAFGMLYGPDGKPGVGVIGASATGTGKGLVQVIPADLTAGKFGAIDPMKLYEVSTYSDVAQLPAITKRNPNNQGRGFIRGLYGVKNPGYQKANGFMPEVKTFALSAPAGYKDVNTSNRESLYFSLIPATWDAAYNTVPGTAGPVAPGPSPVAPQGSPTTNPGPAASDGTGTGGMPSVPSTPAGSGAHAPGYNDVQQDNAGCACSSAPGSSTSGFAGMSLLAMGLALLGFRRTKKES